MKTRILFSILGLLLFSTAASAQLNISGGGAQSPFNIPNPANGLDLGQCAWLANEFSCGTTGTNARVMKIGTNGAQALQLYTTNGTKWVIQTTGGGGGLTPQTDNAHPIGSAAARVSTGYFVTQQVGTSGTTGTLNTGGTVYMSGLTTSSSVQAGAICISSVNQIINDSVACLASAAKFKNSIRPIDSKLGLQTVMSMKPVNFHYNLEGRFAETPDRNQSMEQIGFIADEAEKVDSRLVGYGDDGKVRTFRYENFVAVLTKAVQEQQAEIAELQKRRRFVFKPWTW